MKREANFFHQCSSVFIGGSKAPSNQGGLVLLVRALVALALLPQCTRIERQPVAPQAGITQTLSRDECRAVARDEADPATLLRAAEQSLEYFRRIPADRALPLVDRTLTAGELRGVIEALLAQPPSTGDVASLCDRFTLVRVVPRAPLLVTGYYEPELPARRRRTPRFRYALYGVPDDLVEVELSQYCSTCTGKRAIGRVRNGELVPYHTRAEIDAGAIDASAAPIAWLDDPVEAFFVHVQGSARLRFDDGVHMHVGYGGSNGRPYTSIGKVLIDAGKLAPEQVSLATLKDYLRAHPAERDAILQRNERYVFFRTVAVGPVGSLGVPLTAGRSLAADARFYAPGALVFLKTPAAPDVPALARLALIQDAGVAISGDHRLDVFWGSGETAAAIAGTMQAPGELFVVLPR
jgi:membrane-bound lytic murein transglycosylase A